MPRSIQLKTYCHLIINYQAIDGLIDGKYGDKDQYYEQLNAFCVTFEFENGNFFVILLASYDKANNGGTYSQHLR